MFQNSPSDYTPELRHAFEAWVTEHPDHGDAFRKEMREELSQSKDV